MTRDRNLLLAGAFVRALATGTIGVLIGIHLAKQGLGPAAIGAIVSAGLAGAAVAALLVTVGGDRMGRRRVLVLLSLLGAAGGFVIAGATDPWVVGGAAFLG
ncbi:MAG TPA: MFS transporter, partial [Candidatus Eisenbacteria bacterium]|nr:MFS transporter [Candidatus Eisenbacteria bacterium]